MSERRLILKSEPSYKDLDDPWYDEMLTEGYINYLDNKNYLYTAKATTYIF